MPSKTFPELMKQLESSLVNGSNVISGHELIDILRFCCFKREFLDDFGEQRRRCWFQLMKKKMSELNLPDDVVDAMDCFLHLAIKPEYYHPGYIEMWEAQLMKKLDEAELRHVLEMYLDIPLDPPQELIEKWCDLATKKTDAASNEDLAFILFAFGKFRIQPSETFLKKCIDSATAKLSNFTAIDLAMFAYGAGKLHAALDAEHFENLLQSISRKARDFSAHNAVLCLYGIALLKPPKQMNVNERLGIFYEHFFKLVQKDIATLSAIDQARMIWAVAKLGISFDDSFFAKWRNNLLSCKSTFGPKELSLILKAMLLLQKSADREFGEFWMSRAVGLMPHFWPEVLCRLVADLQKLAITPSAEFQSAWMSEVKHKMHMDIYASDLTGIISGLAMLVQNNSKKRSKSAASSRGETEFIDDWYRASEQRISYYTPAMATEIIDSFAKLNVGEMRPDFKEKLSKQIDNSSRPKSSRPASAAAQRRTSSAKNQISQPP